VAESSVGQLAGEDLEGFAAVSGSQIRVSGSRTVGLFILPAVDARLADASVTASLEDSMSREAQIFAGITSFDVVSERPGVSRVTPIAAADAARFVEMGLSRAEFFDVGVVSERWLVLSVAVRTYAPGTIVYLVVTSEPIVVGSALVRADGTATIVGTLPLALLETGAHRIRVVGSRDFGTITVNARGNLHIPEGTLRQIELFDTETTAVVEALGVDEDGAVRQVVRYIPLHTDPPYWILLVLLDVCLLGLYLRRRGAVQSAQRRAVAASTLLIVAVVIGWIGWTMRYPEITAAAAALLALGVLAVIRSGPTTANEPRPV
jgi:hypothetical protein